MTTAQREKVPEWAWKVFVTAFFALAGYWANQIEHHFEKMENALSKMSDTQSVNAERLTRVEANQTTDHETTQAIRVFLQGHSWDKNK